MRLCDLGSPALPHRQGEMLTVTGLGKGVGYNIN